MSVTQDNIKFTYTGGASNQTPLTSRGGTGSTFYITTGINNLWDNVLASEASVGDEEYRAIDIINESVDSHLYNPKCWVAISNPTDVVISLWYDTGGTVSTLGGGETEGTVPAGSSFSAGYVSEGSALSLGAQLDFGGTDRIRLWIKRKINSGAAAATNVYFTLTVKGETQ